MVSTRWFFTINNYDQADLVTIRSWDSVYCVFGKAVSGTGTPYLQGFATFSKNLRITGVKKLHPSAQWEKARVTSKEASDYCKKDGDYEEIGSVPFRGKRTDLLKETVSASKKHKSLHDFIYTNYPPTHAIVNPYLKKKPLRNFNPQRNNSTD